MACKFDIARFDGLPVIKYSTRPDHGMMRETTSTIEFGENLVLALWEMILSYIGSNSNCPLVFVYFVIKLLDLRRDNMVNKWISR